MPYDDRDRQLEKALERHLPSKLHDATCPDAETLAAYQERTLSLEERGQWIEHISACARCQETLALVGESNVFVGSEEEKRKMREFAGTSFAAADVARHQNLPIGVRVSPARPVAHGSAKKQTPKRAAALGWVVPVGVLAAALLAWVGVRETRQTGVMKSSQVEVARNRPSAPDVPAVSPPAPKLILPKGDETTAAQSRALDELPKQSATALARKPSGSLEKKASPAGAPAMLSIPIPDKEKQKAESQALDALSAPRSRPAPTAASEVSNYAAQNREPPPTQRVAPAAAAPNAVAANQIANTGRMSGQQNQAAKLQTQTADTMEVIAAGGTLSQSMSDVLPEGGTIIVAPNDAYSWRVGSGGKIEHSTDNSRTWMLQKSGVSTDLTAGSATSGKICWVVGKAGTVLLTTDRGKHWKQLASPTKEDLAGVNAVDDKRASIWTASHTKSFETNDGGVTWTAVGFK